MVLVARLDGESGAVKFEALGGVVERDEDPIAGCDFFLVLDAVKFVARIETNDLVAVNFDVVLGQGFIEEGGVLGGGDVSDHDFVG